jgi:general secretion pathway protein G
MKAKGLTYLEMLLVLALASLLALGALPMVHHRYRHMKEIELRRALNEMRTAIDRYHEYAILGQIEPWDLEWNMYPEDLEMLVDGVEVREALDQPPLKIKFLRRVPVDPMTGEAEWNCRGYDDEPDEWSSSCDDLYDVASQSADEALDGSYYRDW